MQTTHILIKTIVSTPRNNFKILATILISYSMGVVLKNHTDMLLDPRKSFKVLFLFFIPGI